MSLPCVEPPIALCHTDSPQRTDLRTVRPVGWALATLIAACSPSDEVVAGSADGTGTTGDPGPGSSSDVGDADTTGPGTTGPGTTESDTTGPGTTGPGTAESSGDDTGPVDPSLAEGSSSTDTGTAGDETAADGCWDYSGNYDYYGYGVDVEPFVCPGLPMPCAPVDLYFYGPSDCEAGTYEFGQDTLAALEETEAAARCVLQSMRDGEAAVHEITLEPGGYETVPGRYVVLGNGVVTEISWFTDLTGTLDQRLLAPRDPEWFDACLAAPDLHGLVPCLWPASVPFLEVSGATPCGDGPFGPVELDACIGEEPSCP